MTQERRQVLDLLIAGKITPDEAERLLDKLAHGPHAPAAGVAGEVAAAPQPGGKPKFLRVVVDSDGDQVNIRVPLALVRTGIALKTMMPPEAQEKLHERGIDLGQLSGLKDDELLDALRELQIDVDTTKGDTVRVFCE